MTRFCCLAAGSLLLCACTSAGGSGSASSSAPPAASPSALGSRGVPGYDLRVDSDGALTPGATRTITIDLTAESGQAAPVLVEAALGSGEPLAWQSGAADLGNLRWTWTMTLPGDLRQQRVWVRLTDAAGNISQSGGDDFALLR